MLLWSKPSKQISFCYLHTQRSEFSTGHHSPVVVTWWLNCHDKYKLLAWMRSNNTNKTTFCSNFFCNYEHIELLIAVCRMWLWYNRATNISPPEHSIDDTSPHLFDRYQNGNKCLSIFVFEDVHEMISDTNYWIQLIKTRNVFPCKIGHNHHINPFIVTLHWFILVEICRTKLHRIFRSLSWNAIDFSRFNISHQKAWANEIPTKFSVVIIC